MNGGLLKPKTAAINDDHDTAEESSDCTSSEEEEKKSELEEEKEDDKEPKFFMHQYTVDIIAEFKDHDEELVLHWALGKKTASEWARPDDNQFPKGTTRFKDNVACQTVFDQNIVYPEYRTVQF